MRLSPTFPIVCFFAALIFLVSDQSFAKKTAYNEVNVLDGGKISGKVTFEGALPENAIQTYSNLKSPEICGEKTTIKWVDVNDGALRGVFVMIDKIKEGKPWPAEMEQPKVMDQKGCAFLPWMQVIKPGAVIIRNSDEGLLHNVNAKELVGVEKGRDIGKTLFNVAQPDVGEMERDIAPRRVPYVGVSCQTHEQMYAYILAPSHPYATIVDDNGAFVLGNVPPGKYVIKAWHPRLGVQKTTVVVPEKGEAQANFRFQK